jgi:hypothetical protein
MHRSIPVATGDRWTKTMPTATADKIFIPSDLPMDRGIYHPVLAQHNKVLADAK